MGADGHIAIYDAEKVTQILAEINEGLTECGHVWWPGYFCDWTCNGKPAAIVYWGDNIMEWPFDSPKLWELERRANAEALLVENQEVWT